MIPGKCATKEVIKVIVDAVVAASATKRRETGPCNLFTRVIGLHFIIPRVLFKSTSTPHMDIYANRGKYCSRGLGKQSPAGKSFHTPISLIAM